VPIWISWIGLARKRALFQFLTTAQRATSARTAARTCVLDSCVLGARPIGDALYNVCGADQALERRCLLSLLPVASELSVSYR
jgi:hypothetical protein